MELSQKQICKGIINDCFNCINNCYESNGYYAELLVIYTKKVVPETCREHLIRYLHVFFSLSETAVVMTTRLPLKLYIIMK